MNICNEFIWLNVTEINSIVVQGNGVIGEYMSTTFYAKIFLTPYQKLNDTWKIQSTQQGQHKCHAKVSSLTGSATNSGSSPAIITNTRSRSNHCIGFA